MKSDDEPGGSAGAESGPAPSSAHGGSEPGLRRSGGLPAPSRPVAVGSTTVTARDDLDVPRGLRVAASWAWRILLLVLAGAAILWVVAKLQLVVVPLVIALLLCALLSPLVGLLLRAKLPRTLAVTIVMIAGIAAVAGVLTLVINQFVDGAPELSAKATAGIDRIQDSLRDGPLGLSEDQWKAMTDNLGSLFTSEAH